MAASCVKLRVRRLSPIYLMVLGDISIALSSLQVANHGFRLLPRFFGFLSFRSFSGVEHILNSRVKNLRKNRIFVWALRFFPSNWLRKAFFLGGDPAAGSPTATLLRLLPPREA